MGTPAFIPSSSSFTLRLRWKPPPRASFSFQRRRKEPGSLSGVSEETPKQKQILAGPGDETTPPLPVIPDGDSNGGVDEADLFRKCLFALCDNWAVTCLERVADMMGKELTDVGTERTSTYLLSTIPQSASNYTVIHSIAAIFAQWGRVGGLLVAGWRAGDTSPYFHVN